MFLVNCFLTFSFFSLSLGKHYLVETNDASDGDDTDGLDMNKVDAETLIFTLFKDEELDRFKNLPEKNQKKIITDIDKVIEYVRDGNKDFDYYTGVMEEILKLTGRDKMVLNGLTTLIQLLPGGKDNAGTDYLAP